MKIAMTMKMRMENKDKYADNLFGTEQDYLDVLAMLEARYKSLDPVEKERIKNLNDIEKAENEIAKIKAKLAAAKDKDELQKLKDTAQAEKERIRNIKALQKAQEDAENMMIELFHQLLYLVELLNHHELVLCWLVLYLLMLIMNIRRRCLC